ncbi:nucleotidyltransferase family protein [candidate division WOR-3 bacterium]|nr:nucleotidyltransferase family protein [candidate division WOR-3 bacterium]
MVFFIVCNYIIFENHQKDMQMFYEDIFREFNNHEIQFVVVGGVAFNLLGGMRSTQDLDLIVLMSDENLKRIVNVLKNNGYSPRHPVNADDLAKSEIRNEWISKRNMKAFSFIKDLKSFEQIDLIIDCPIDFLTAHESAEIINIGDFSIPVISPENLIKMKEHAGREIDLADIKELKAILKINGN